MVEKEIRTVRLTRVAQALSDALDAAEPPITTDYKLFLKLREIYEKPEGLYLRDKTLSVATYRRTRKLLIEVKKLTRDTDYPGAYRILSKQDLSADDIACLVDPFCYISHLSAMQRYGLTDRRPEALHLTVPANKIIKDLIHAKIKKDYGDDLSTSNNETHILNIVHHPQVVRKRELDIFSTVNYGDSIQVRGSYARISTIGQTFLDMLEEPQRCGGMTHILDVWKEHARNYMNDIISAIDKAPKSIHKVRAGYILQEVMGINKPEIEKWLDFAQRGGSRLLDPVKPFVSNYSEKWMISINV